MQLVSIYTSIPYNIMTGTKAGKLMNSKLIVIGTPSPFGDTFREQFMDRNKQLLDKYFGE